MQPPPLSSSLQTAAIDALQDELSSPRYDQLSEEHCRQLGEAHYRLSKIYYDKSDFELAKHHFALSLELCRGTKDFYFEFKVLGFLIRMASEALDQETAEKYIQRSEDITERISHELGTFSAEVLYNMGIVKTYNGRFEEAFQDFQIATTKAKQENNPEVLAKIYYALASSNYQQKKSGNGARHSVSAKRITLYYQQGLSQWDNEVTLRQYLFRTWKLRNRHSTLPRRRC